MSDDMTRIDKARVKALHDVFWNIQKVIDKTHQEKKKK